MTERAEAEIFEIFLFGIEQFGTAQARRYKDELMHCFERLGDNPRMGRAANSLAPGVRRHEHRSHVILYEIERPGILILAVVHGRSLRRLKL
nr:type II toxin-antitoxin system RelE/ParE family toxin [Aurantimonas marianensis]